MSDTLPEFHCTDVSRTNPSACFAFLFTDIEGSTRRWEESPRMMEAALARHDAILRDAIRLGDGQVFKTVGDAFCGVFPDTARAISAAYAAQKRLGSQGFTEVGGLAVRMAIHFGSAEIRDGDYFGQTLNRIARLLSLAQGGQILVTGIAAELTGSDLPDDCELIDLGTHRLRDISDPVHIHQLAGPGLRKSVQPLVTVDTIRTNLPQPLTAFIGREAELVELQTHLQRHRLVTVAGAGGMGKTRITIETGRAVIDRFSDGVWFFELAPIMDAQIVPETICAVFGLTGNQSASRLDLLTGYLQRRNCLLILDNCEHLVKDVLNLVDKLLRTCSQLSILTSSREPLGIGGEMVYRLPAMSYPARTMSINAEDALHYEAVRFFTERVSTAVPGFTLNDANAPYIASICQRLDGMALSLELAAPRLRMMSAVELEKRLDNCFRIITGGNKTSLPRQQTLKALIDWSYQLLGEEERIVLDRLSIFAGGCTLEGASAVCSGGVVGQDDILDILASLVDKSLVIAETYQDGKASRFKLLETTRQYGSERLMQRGETGIMERLADHMLALYTRAYESWPVTGTDAWLASFGPDLDNLRLVLDWAFSAKGNEHLGLDLLGRSAGIFIELSRISEMSRWIDLARSRLSEAHPPTFGARIDLAWLNCFYYFNHQVDEPVAAKAAAIFTADGDRAHAALALAYQAALVSDVNDTSKGRQLVEVALDSLKNLGNNKYHELGLFIKATLAYWNKDTLSFQHNAETELAIAKTIGNRYGLRRILVGSAEVKYGTGNTEGALQLVHEAIVECEKANDHWRLAIAYGNLASYLLSLDRVEEAVVAGKSSIRNARDVGRIRSIYNTCERLALAAALSNRLDTAAFLAGCSSAWIASKGFPREHTEQSGYERLMAILADKLPEDERIRLMAEGSLWTLDQAIAISLSM